MNERIIGRVMIEVNGTRKKKLERSCLPRVAASTGFRSASPLRIGVLFASMLIALLTACAAAGSARWSVAVFPSGAEFALEIVQDAQSRARGYMFRESVGPHEAMLFVFEEKARHGFWMKNCKVNLDIIWLDESFRVVEIAHDLPPCPAEGACPSSEPMQAASFVLEVAGGTARAQGLRRGDRLVLLEERAAP
jgi:uncharacterized membrane protein (UPF0127 family)